MKLYAKETEYAAAAGGLAAAARVQGIRSPEPVAVVPERRLTVRRFLPGTQPRPEAAAEAAGGLVAHLPPAGQPPAARVGAVPPALDYYWSYSILSTLLNLLERDHPKWEERLAFYRAEFEGVPHRVRALGRLAAAEVVS